MDCRGALLGVVVGEVGERVDVALGAVEDDVDVRLAAVDCDVVLGLGRVDVRPDEPLFSRDGDLLVGVFTRENDLRVAISLLEEVRGLSGLAQVCRGAVLEERQVDADLRAVLGVEVLGESRLLERGVVAVDGTVAVSVVLLEAVEDIQRVVLLAGGREVQFAVVLVDGGRSIVDDDVLGAVAVLFDGDDVALVDLTVRVEVERGRATGHRGDGQDGDDSCECDTRGSTDVCHWVC